MLHALLLQPVGDRIEVFGLGVPFVHQRVPAGGVDDDQPALMIPGLADRPVKRGCALRRGYVPDDDAHCFSCPWLAWVTLGESFRPPAGSAAGSAWPPRTAVEPSAVGLSLAGLPAAGASATA